MKVKPPKACPMAKVTNHSCIHIVCPDCLAVQFKRYDEKTDQEKEQMKARTEKLTCRHDNPYTLIDIHHDYVVGKYADNVRSKEEDNFLPTHCAECKGKFIYIKAKKKTKNNSKKQQGN